jgi:quinohemoprotein ethanol dehydrogenase
MGKAGALLAALLMGAGLTAAGHCGRTAKDISTARLLDDGSGVDWAGPGGTFGEQHYSPLRQVSAKTIGKLGLAWSTDLPPGNSTTAPIEVGGKLFFVTGLGLVHAVDAATGRPLWQYDAKVYDAKNQQRVGEAWGPRGIAWWNDKIYLGTMDGRLIAIDAKSGKEVWSRQTLVEGDFNYITGAPRVFDGKVIIGFGGADINFTRGYVSTYDAESGKLLWRWYTVPGDPAKGFENAAMEMAAKTWAGEWWKMGGGGTVWNAMTYDPETDTIFLGTGNGGPWNHKVRSAGKGDNLFLCSIVALDAKTGTYKWHYQFNPGESWDFNSVFDMPLATLMIGGVPRKVVMQAPKNGFFYVLDRETGQLLSAEPFVKVNWATKIDLATGRPVENPAARYPGGATFQMWPSGQGGHNWPAMAFSPRTNLVYIPTIEKTMTWTDYKVAGNAWMRDQPQGSPQTATANTLPQEHDPLNNTSALKAWNPVTQKLVWSQQTPSIEGGGAMATAGDLVFQGRLDGRFNAYDARSGTLLWSFDAKAPIIAPPISYSIAGRQYVSVLTGLTGSRSMMGEQLASFHLEYRSEARRVLTFALGGTRKLPPRKIVTLRPAPDPGYKADDAAAARGATVYHQHCYLCHGIGVVSGGGAPELRASDVPASGEAFHAIVKGGALLPAGMPRFDYLSDADVEDMRQYIRSRAAAWRTGAKGPAVPTGASVGR